jgi:hypothetical protein
MAYVLVVVGVVWVCVVLTMRVTRNRRCHRHDMGVRWSPVCQPGGPGKVETMDRIEIRVRGLLVATVVDMPGDWRRYVATLYHGQGSDEVRGESRLFTHVADALTAATDHALDEADR